MSQAQFNTLTIIGSCFTIIISIISLLVKIRFDNKHILQQQLELVYSPLFKHIAPALYKETGAEEINMFRCMANTIIENNYHLCHPTLIENCSLLSKHLQSNIPYKHIYKEICNHIDLYYDKLCRKLHIPVRSMFFRFRNSVFLNSVAFAFMRLCL